MKHDLPAFALLIDADNDTPEIIAPIIEEITRHARISVRRVYGDFTTPHLAGWRETLANHGIHPVQQYRNSVGKNASDSALIIDAMDLLHAGRLDGFCLVSSDGDFTRLATRIRENGLSVFGFGRKHAPKAFVNACERYIYVENLSTTPDIAINPLPVKEEPKLPKNAVTKAAAVKIAQASELTKLKSLLLRAYTNVADEDAWALLSRVALYLRSNHSDFDPRTYGSGNFLKLLQSVEIFDFAQRKQGNGLAHFCRPQRRHIADDYVEALKAAVQSAQAGDGWSNILGIGAYLREHGVSLAQSGCTSLTEALHASGLFEMRDSTASGKDFRPAQLHQ